MDKPKTENTKMNRREFIKGGIVLSTAVAVPFALTYEKADPTRLVTIETISNPSKLEGQARVYKKNQSNNTFELVQHFSADHNHFPNREKLILHLCEKTKAGEYSESFVNEKLGLNILRFIS